MRIKGDNWHNLRYIVSGECYLLVLRFLVCKRARTKHGNTSMPESVMTLPLFIVLQASGTFLGMHDI